MAEEAATGEASAAMPAVQVGLRPALRHRSFQLLFGGQAVSAMGDWILPVAVAIELVRRGRPLQDLAWVIGARALATGLVVLFGGVLADRFRRTRVMISADVIRAAAVAVVLVGWHSLDIPAVVSALFVFGIGEAIFRPAYNAIMPRVVPASALGSANAVNTLSQRLAAVLGPAIAGVLFAALGGPAALGIDIATFAVSTATLLGVSESSGLRNPIRRFAFRAALEGAEAVWRRAWIRWLIFAGLIQVACFVAPWFVFLPVITQHRYGGAPAYTLCLSCFGIGAIAGSVAASRYRGNKPGMVGLPAVCLLAPIMLALAVPAPLWLLAAAHLTGGFGIDLFGVLWYTALQKDVPDRLLGRVMSFDLLTSKVTTPIAYALIAPVATLVGRQTVLIVGALACVVPILPLLALRSVRTLSSASPPAQAELEPEPA